MFPFVRIPKTEMSKIPLNYFEIFININKLPKYTIRNIFHSRWEITHVYICEFESQFATMILFEITQIDVC